MFALPFLAALFAGIVAAYYFLVRGLLWKGILFVVGLVSMWIVLSTYPAFQGEVFRIGGMGFSLAATLPIVLGFLVLITTRERDI